jgi:hypothetical protein
MTRFPLPGRLAACALAATAALATAGQAANAASPAPDVPGTIAVGDEHKPFLTGHAAGVQIYSCVASAGGYAWAPATPRAILYDDAGHAIADHFGGPSWRARDGSTVVARRVDGVTVDPTAIQWLKLEVTSRTSGADGDRLTPTTYIQRVATTGGLPPDPAACDGANAGTSREVPYTADYVFWKRRGA